MTEDNSPSLSELKLEINNLIWEKAHPHMTLIEAEQLACKIFDLVMDANRVADNNGMPRTGV